MFISLNLKRKNNDYIYILIIVIYNIITKFNSHGKNKSHNLIFKMSMFIFYIFEKIIFKNKSNTQLPLKTINFRKLILILSSNIFILLFIYIKMKIKKDDLFGNPFMIFFMDMIFIKKRIYSHHYLSFFINAIVFILIYKFHYLNEFDNKKIEFIIYIISILLLSYCYCFSYLLVKQINTIYFTSIFFLMALMALSEALYKYNKMIRIFKTFNFGVIELIYYILGNILYQFCKCQILIKYDVTHFITINTIVFLLYISKKIDYLYIFIFLISSMIYLEIIELHFCELNKNLKNEIIKRGESELFRITKDPLTENDSESENAQGTDYIKF